MDAGESLDSGLSSVNYNIISVVTSGGVSYTIPSSGGVSRSLLSKLQDVVSVLDFGADKTGATDSTSAMQAAHNTGRVVYYPAGTYKFTTITIATGGILGESPGTTILETTDATTANIVSITGSDSGGISGAQQFMNFTLQTSTGATQKTTGAALYFNVSGGSPNVLTYPVVQNMTILNIPTSVQFVNAAQFIVDNCNLLNWSVTGINIANTYLSDMGDSSISNCFINTGVTSTTSLGIFHQSSGGLKVVNTKILGGGSGYVMGWNGTNSADIFFSNCSIEDTYNFGMYFSRYSGSGSVGSIMIQGCEIGCPSGIETDGSTIITLLNISGCVFDVLGGGGQAAGQALVLGGVSNFSIGPCIFNNQGGNASAVAISILSSSSNGKVEPQVFVGFQPSVKFVNGSSTTWYNEVPQTGIVSSITTSTGYGSLYVGSSAVNFPVAFSVAPQVVCYPGSTGGGGVSAFATGITTTGFTYTLLGVTNGGSASNNVWTTIGGVL
jgi:hypothetical protein